MTRTAAGRDRLSRTTTVANIASALAALVVAGILLIGVQFLSLRASLVAELRIQAEIVGNSSAAALMFGDAATAMESLIALQAAPHVVAAELIARDGEGFVRYPVGASPIPLGDARQLTEVVVRHDIEVDGAPVGAIRLQATLKGLYLRLLGYVGVMVLVAVGSLGVSLPLMARMRRRIVTAEAHLEHLAHSDPVTELPNRHAFNERLRELFSAPQPPSVALLLIDLDNFKVVNDTMGHPCGDALLDAVARRLTSAAPDADMVCRMGGDEFAILAVGRQPQAQAQELAERALALLGRPVTIQGQQLHVSASIGSSVSPDDGADGEVLTRNADTAMYYAKQRGKRAWAPFRQEMTDRARARLRLERDLRAALEHGDLAVHYQPQVRLHDRRIVGVEALLRWNGADGAAISPAEFIPVTEETGLIVPLGRHVLDRACRQGAHWLAQGFGPLRLAVNVSVRQLRDAGFVDDVLGALGASGFPPQLLELEITESLLMESREVSVAALHRLRGHGIAISIDDFGTGYSSLAYLPSLPINQLKIDSSFVRRIPGDGAAITTAIVALARSFDLSLVAEGVERPEQLEFLERAGCPLVQGWLFAPALPAERLLPLLTQGLPGAAGDEPRQPR